MDKTLQRKLRDLGRAVFEAIAESPDVGRALDFIRAEGYTLSMQLNCRKGDASIGIDGPVERRVESRLLERRPLEGSPVKSLPASDPAFRIDGEDLRFLRSIGIDPTRRLRRRR
jgi:hypothetical protein